MNTHLLLLAATAPQRLSAEAQALFSDRHNELYFSAVSIWRQFRRGLIDNGYQE